jgi:hypothetical protein
MVPGRERGRQIRKWYEGQNKRAYSASFVLNLLLFWSHVKVQLRSRSISFRVMRMGPVAARPRKGSGQCPRNRALFSTSVSWRGNSSAFPLPTLAPLLSLLSPSREEPCSLVAPRVSPATAPRLILQKICSLYPNLSQKWRCFLARPGVLTFSLPFFFRL